MTNFEIIFQSDISNISLRCLKMLCARCRNGDYDDQFLGPKLPRSGGPELVIDDFDGDTFVKIFVDRPQTTLKSE